MSGNSRIIAGEIAQGKLKGKNLEKALASALNNAIPPVIKKSTGKKKNK